MSINRRTIVVLTCRSPQTDFRFPLARELANMGHDVHYVFVKRKPVVHRMAEGTTDSMSILAFAVYMRKLSLSNPKLLVLNSTNLVFPIISFILRRISRGAWCLDLHDDLLYEHNGWNLRKAQLSQMILKSSSDFSVHAATTLIELFPSSHHLGNASDLLPLQRDEFNVRDILILASLDGRFDFDLTTNVAQRNPDMQFHIHGQISKANPKTYARLQSIIQATGNIIYHGPYANDDLPIILKRYSITLAPYVTNSRLTRYIDPLRYYHCLNSGMEVVTTDIPTARELQPYLSIIESPDTFAPLVRGLAREQKMRRNSGAMAHRHNWRSKAELFMRIVACDARHETEAHG